MKSEFGEKESPSQRIKLCEDLRTLIQEHGSNKVIGMLQAFTLLETEIRTKLIATERKLI